MTQLRFTDYDGLASDDLYVWGMKDGVEDYFAPNEVLPMSSADIEDEDGYWTVISEKLGRITFQSIDIEEVN